MTTTQWLILLISLHAANLVGLFLLNLKHSRWRRGMEKDLDARVNEIIHNRNERIMHDTGRRSMPRLDAGEPARVSRARITRGNRQA